MHSLGNSSWSGETALSMKFSLFQISYHYLHLLVCLALHTWVERDIDSVLESACIILGVLSQVH